MTTHAAHELPRSCEAQNDSTRASAPNASFGYRGQNAGPVKARDVTMASSHDVTHSSFGDRVARTPAP